MISTSKKNERIVNYELGKLLHAKYGIEADGEHSAQAATGMQSLDVHVLVDGITVVIETKIGQGTTRKKLAVADADRRSMQFTPTSPPRLKGWPGDDSKPRQGLADITMALCYPENVAPDKLEGIQLIWQLRDYRSINDLWERGDVGRLAEHLRQIPEQMGDPDHVASKLSYGLDKAVQRLSKGAKTNLVNVLGMAAPENPKSTWLDMATKRAMLVIATAVMFHAHLDKHLESMKPEMDNRTDPPSEFKDPWPPDKAGICWASKDPVGSYYKAWDLIQALDYKPIFEVGCKALNSNNSHEFAVAVKICAGAALEVARNLASRRHDLLGRIFHKVLDTAPSDGSFYTSTAAGTLLASLAITPDQCDWGNQDAVSEFRVVDPACGTGTLLMASAARIRNLVKPPATGTGAERFSTDLIERILTGYDINLTATHMTATTLGLISPSTSFSKMNIGHALLGRYKDTNSARIGSLELMPEGEPNVKGVSSADAGVQQRLEGTSRADVAAKQVETRDEMEKPDPFDLVIMNPPFTRDSLRHAHFGASEAQLIRRREKEIFADHPVHLSSSSGPFLLLADALLKPDNGTTLAFVQPIATATSYSLLKMRQYLAERFHIETIVASQDPERMAFSENTNIGEMLVICRRADDETRKQPTRIINLAVNPSVPTEALSLASEILAENLSAKWGLDLTWPAERIQQGDWDGVQFLNYALSNHFISIREGKLFPSIALGEVASIKPDGRLVRGAFNREVPGDYHALWDHNADHTQSMRAKTDTYMSPREGKSNTAARVWEQRGRLLLPQRLSTPTTRASAVYSGEPTLGSAWMPCHFRDIGFKPALAEKALCAYFNSSIGLLAMLGGRTNFKLVYPRFSSDDLKHLLVPDFQTLGKKPLKDLADAYDRFAGAILLPYRQMMECPTRPKLDGAVSHALGVKVSDTEAIRDMLAREPSITGKRAAFGLGPL